MTKSITVQIKIVYGNELIYPVCEVARLLLSLTKKKSFDRSDIQVIKDLGYEIKIDAGTL